MTPDTVKVPKEATTAMIDAGVAVWTEQERGPFYRENLERLVRETWTAMNAHEIILSGAKAFLAGLLFRAATPYFGRHFRLWLEGNMIASWLIFWAIILLFIGLGFVAGIWWSAP